MLMIGINHKWGENEALSLNAYIMEYNWAESPTSSRFYSGYMESNGSGL